MNKTIPAVAAAVLALYLDHAARLRHRAHMQALRQYRTSVTVRDVTMLPRPDTPGLAVWKSGHIGVYIGNGEVIEAMGTKYGVVKTKLAGRGWSAWLQIPYISYITK